MAVRPNLDLSKIYRAPVFQTRSARDAQYELSRHLIDHGLRWHPGDVTASLHRRELDRISLMILQYGTEVEVSPLAFDDFALVQMPLRGSVQIECEGTNIRVAPGEVAVVPPSCTVRLLWEPRCEQLILRIPNSLLKADDWDHHRLLENADSPANICKWEDPAYKMRPELLELWVGMLQQAVAMLPAGAANPLHPGWLNHFEQTLASFVYAHQPSMLESAQHAREAEASALGYRPGQCPQLDRLESYIRSRLFAPLSLVDLARAAGVTTRTLNAICHRHRGVAPMTLVRNLRLDAARQRLLSGAPTSVTEVALEYGFGHLGRFSSYYRERFGELPKQTGRTLKEAQYCR